VAQVARDLAGCVQLAGDLAQAPPDIEGVADG
jgi:hypothetical protein